MTTQFQQNFPDNEVCQVLTCLPEKFVVDFANGIHVTQDHLRAEKDRRFFQRVSEGLSGKASERQHVINASLAQGVEASLYWLTELTASLATTNHALTQVNDRVSSLVNDTAAIAHYSADTREQLLSLAEQVNKKMTHLEQQLNRVDLLQRGQLHLDQVFSWWGAGRYASLPLAGRCYVALEELRWGAFGDVIRHGETRQSTQLLDILKHKASTQLAQDNKSGVSVRHNSQHWLAWQAGKVANNDWLEAINWIGDWCNQDSHPVVWSTTQVYGTLPLRMPRLSSAERIAESMVDEVFSKVAA
ncbi:YjcZ-like family protein [Pectobacterium polonicum]|uniref:YjcZ-like family protein n=1 Tax=Pectobacterium polonicum TaxID=2485124 RepID=A0AAE9SW55_9GAMM|nr:YjcZ-like family protein [Pectobacterium polonicum]UVO07163.1 YjcZ-like family protein [Pectobacterium polonicum]